MKMVQKWKSFCKHVSIWSLISTLSGAGASAVTFQYNKNMLLQSKSEGILAGVNNI